MACTWDLFLSDIDAGPRPFGGLAAGAPIGPASAEPGQRTTFMAHAYSIIDELALQGEYNLLLSRGGAGFNSPSPAPLKKAAAEPEAAAASSAAPSMAPIKLAEDITAVPLDSAPKQAEAAATPAASEPASSAPAPAAIVAAEVKPAPAAQEPAQIKAEPKVEEQKPVAAAPVAAAVFVPAYSDALEFLAGVKARFGDGSEKYSAFLAVLGQSQRQEINVAQTTEKVNELFAGEADLLDGFNLFIPKSKEADAPAPAAAAAPASAPVLIVAPKPVVAAPVSVAAAKPASSLIHELQANGGHEVAEPAAPPASWGLFGQPSAAAAANFAPMPLVSQKQKQKPPKKSPALFGQSPALGWQAQPQQAYNGFAGGFQQQQPQLQPYHQRVQGPHKPVQKPKQSANFGQPLGPAAAPPGGPMMALQSVQAALESNEQQVASLQEALQTERHKASMAQIAHQRVIGTLNSTVAGLRSELAQTQALLRAKDPAAADVAAAGAGAAFNPFVQAGLAPNPFVAAGLAPPVAAGAPAGDIKEQLRVTRASEANALEMLREVRAQLDALQIQYNDLQFSVQVAESVKQQYAAGKCPSCISMPVRDLRVGFAPARLQQQQAKRAAAPVPAAAPAPVAVAAASAPQWNATKPFTLEFAVTENDLPEQGEAPGVAAAASAAPFNPKAAAVSAASASASAATPGGCSSTSPGLDDSFLSAEAYGTEPGDARALQDWSSDDDEAEWADDAVAPSRSRSAQKRAEIKGAASSPSSCMSPGGVAESFVSVSTPAVALETRTLHALQHLSPSFPAHGVSLLHVLAYLHIEEAASAGALPRSDLNAVTRAVKSLSNEGRIYATTSPCTFQPSEAGSFSFMAARSSARVLQALLLQVLEVDGTGSFLSAAHVGQLLPSIAASVDFKPAQALAQLKQLGLLETNDEGHYRVKN